MPSRRKRTFDEISRSFDEVAQSQQAFLSTDRLSRFAGNWVAIYKGGVAAVGADLATVRGQLERDKVPLGTVVFRFIQENGVVAS